MGVKSKMNTITTLFSLACISSSVLGDESFHGMGSMKCYGDMSITLGGQEDNGFLDCQPAWGSPAAPPQGIIADGQDGSHCYCRRQGLRGLRRNHLVRVWRPGAGL